MKHLLCALAMAVAIVSQSVPARATVIINANGGRLVLNNGIILLHNESREPAAGPAIEHRDSGIMQDRVEKIAPGDIWLANKCCYAAGTRYTLRAFGRDFTFVPHLCFRNGIPYGYAELTLISNPGYASGVSIDEIHGTCYTGEL